ncbi:MAG: FtsW/RodA/SpoVE family cell cycle protein [Candidatus Nanopelagicales bacterium]|nr:FtsW/RodA/SpoVE family cell cycle protein [Candidatus Nanopelagicales bacterium]MDZ4250563.1 FtsW/RodA/SpoVE family cell cycle protein [Candidatus Nanopelagicales bacterium]
MSLRTRAPERAVTVSGTSARIRMAAVRMDWLLIAAALVLSVLGCVLVWSATQSTDGAGPARRQALSLVIAVFLAFAVTRVEARALRGYAMLGYACSLLLLLLPFTPMGISISGARAWVAVPGGFTLQPSEFAKLALILALASVLVGDRPRLVQPGVREVAAALGVAGVPVLIVLAQRDTGTALVMVGITGAMLLVAGVPRVWLAALAGTAITVGVLAWRLGALADYQIARFRSFLDPASDALGSGHNTLQARTAIGAGGLFGSGLFSGPQTQGGFVPVNDSDFIFTVAAEELGFVGALALVVALAVVCWRGLRTASEALDLFGRLVAVGCVAWFAFQGFENIGMNLGLMPVTGVTLPFVSYGGSSLIATWLGIGLLQLVRLASGRSS